MPEQRPSLRERKKLATRAALAQATWRLTIERGYAHTRIEDIAEAAGVSARTFSNYFSGKDEALLSVGADRGARMVAALRTCPDDADLWEALAHAMSEQFAGQGEVPRDIAGRIAFPPELAARRGLHASIEVALAAAIADRTGTDASRDLYPRLVARRRGQRHPDRLRSLAHQRQHDSQASRKRSRDVLRQVAQGHAPPHRPSTHRMENTESKGPEWTPDVVIAGSRAHRAHARL